MDVKLVLTELARDLTSLQHADMVRGADMSERGQRIDRMLAKVRAAVATIEAEAEQAEVKQ